jgi:hypothetical protein
MQLTRYIGDTAANKIEGVRYVVAAAVTAEAAAAAAAATTA